MHRPSILIAVVVRSRRNIKTEKSDDYWHCRSGREDRDKTVNNSRGNSRVRITRSRCTTVQTTVNFTVTHGHRVGTICCGGFHRGIIQRSNLSNPKVRLIPFGNTYRYFLQSKRLTEPYQRLT